MSLIDLCERGLVPDAVTRYGIRRLCARSGCKRKAAHGRRAAQQRLRSAARRNCASSPIAIETAAANAQHYELPTALLRALPGHAAEVFELLLPDRHAKPWTRPRTPCSSCTRERARARRRPAHPRARLRLGLADAVDGAALPERAHHRGVQLAHAARAHRGAAAASAASPTSRSSPATSISWTCRGRRVRPLRVDRDVRAHAQLRAPCSARIARWLAPGGKLFVHIFCHRRPDVPVRDRGRGQLDGAILLHRRADALRRHPAALPATTCASRSAGCCRARTTSAPPTTGWRTRTRTATK